MYRAITQTPADSGTVFVINPNKLHRNFRIYSKIPRNPLKHTAIHGIIDIYLCLLKLH